MLPGIHGGAGLVGAVISGGGLSASASPPAVSKTQGSFGPGALTLTSNTTTVTPAGGVAPFTYAWAYLSGDTGVNPTAASSATSAFSGSIAVGEVKSTTFRCTVTDANGATATASVTCTLNHVDLN